MLVVVQNPDNERGVRAIDHATGAVVADGFLVLDALSSAERPPRQRWEVGVRFVAEPVEASA